MKFSHRMDHLQTTNNKDPKTIDQVLDESGLRKIMSRVRVIHELDRWLQSNLQKPLGYHCRVMNIEGKF